MDGHCDVKTIKLVEFVDRIIRLFSIINCQDITNFYWCVYVRYLERIKVDISYDIFIYINIVYLKGINT